MSIQGNSAAPGVAKPVATPKVMARLWLYLKPHIGVLILAMVAMAIVSATEPAVPALLKPLLDKGFGSHDHSSARWWIPLAVVGLALLRGVAQYAANYLLS